MSLELLIATKNLGKVRELERLLSDFPITLRSLNEFEGIIEPEETGKTFAENAILKAKYYAEKTGISALADDSGLEVDALNGAPGVFSARYAGENATDEQRNIKLLSELENVSKEKRQARFVCAMAISDKNSIIEFIAEGVSFGELAFYPKGANGFGYDPIFIPQGFLTTFGEISAETKHKISHRGRAMEKIIAFLTK